MANTYDLNGRIAVVTGGAQGFGRAVAERFAQSGAKVDIWDMDIALAEKTAGEIGAGVRAIKTDVSDFASVEAARDATLAAHGKIDILVNNAGIAGDIATTVDTEVKEWRRVVAINLDGPFLCCKAVVPSMIANNYGRVINIASIAGKEGNPNAAHYSASKAGLMALTKSLGKELAELRDFRQRDHAGGGQDGDLRPDQPAAHRLHALQDPAPTVRQGGRAGEHGGVAGVG